MSDKNPTFTTTFNYSYSTGGSTRPAPQAKPRLPRILVIASVPDDNKVLLDYTTGNDSRLSFNGNFAFGPKSNQFYEIVLGGKKPVEPEFPRPDFALVRTCDPDKNLNGLLKAQEILEKHNIPSLNRPEKIIQTRRDEMYRKYADFDGIVMPKTLRIRPRYCRDVRDFIQREQLRLPCIFRPAGGHNSRGMFLIEKIEDTDELERFAFDDNDFYISEFHDCRDEDGLYRKFRLVCVDGKLYPRHLFIADNWQVDAVSKFNDEKHHAEEQEFLATFEQRLGVENIERLERLAAEIGLDIFGMDLNLRPDGTLVLFEANACMTYFRKSGREYMTPYIDAVKAALHNMIMKTYESVSASS